MKAVMSACALVAMIFAVSCENEKDLKPAEFPQEARLATEILFDSLAIDTLARVYAVGPLPGGTVLREFVPDTESVPSVITLPTSGTIYAFFINDRADLNWAHAVRYAWVNPGTGEFGVIGADWPMLIDRPDGVVEPFSLIAAEYFSGVHVRFGSGGGSIFDGPDVNKPADTLLASSGPRSLDAPCKKLGFVFDAGDWSEFWEEEGISAGAMADNANYVQTFLEGNGFDVTRRSQYTGNNYKAFKRPGDMANQLRDRIRSFASEFECPCDGDPGCHEFFLYICAHGDGDVVSIWEPGKDNFSWFKYEDLNSWLSGFPPCVKVIVFLDICKAGNAENDLAAQCNLRADCGFTLIMSCDSDNSTPTGYGPTDSGTEDWAEAADEDYDNDGKIGDLGDRWLNLADENSDYSPQRFMCPGQTAMCSTD